MRPIPRLFLCAAALMLCSIGWAHGGAYRGPGDVAPPNAGGSSGGAASPSTPRNSGGWDVTTWEYWWGFNKAPSLR